MAFSSVITAFGTLLGCSTEQRGPAVTSCLQLLLCHPPTQSAHTFSTTSSRTFPERSRSWHPHPLPGVPCPIHRPFSHSLCSTSEQLQWKTWAGLREDHESQLVEDRACRHCPTPDSRDTTTRRCEGTAAVFKRQFSNKQLAHTHSCCLLEERHHALFKENSSKALRVVENCCCHTQGWTWTTSTTDCDAENSSWA